MKATRILFPPRVALCHELREAIAVDLYYVVSVTSPAETTSINQEYDGSEGTASCATMISRRDRWYSSRSSRLESARVRVYATARMYILLISAAHMIQSFILS